MLKRIATSLARRAGLELLPAWRLPRLAAARQLQDPFALLDTDTVIDVGANNGQCRDFLRREVGFDGAIVSIEPVPSLAAALRERAASDPRWLVETCALGAANGTVVLNVMVGDQFSSVLAPDPSRVGDFAGQNVVRERVEVPPQTLDALYPAIVARTGARVAHLKLDTQGFDLEVARGARTALATIASVQTGIAFEPIYAGAPDYAQSIRTFQAAGFVPSAMFGNNGGHFPRQIELDCFPVSEDALERARPAGRG